MIWLIGCKGMLGTEVSNQFDKNNFEWIGTDREVDITDYESLKAFASKYCDSDKKIDWIVNCAAYTAVDKAEEDVELATKLNALGPKNIATLCKEINANQERRKIISEKVKAFMADPVKKAEWQKTLAKRHKI
jgi:dTDP-4-dehydrorhamnose reductase